MEVTNWESDALGRETRRNVLNRVTGGWDAWTTSWDTGGVGIGWVGAPRTTTDPAGTVTYTYADEAFGGFGQATSASRTLTGLAGGVAFGMGHDFDLRETRRTWPSTTVVTHEYGASGFLMSSTVNAPGAANDAEVTYAYDEYGLASDWIATGGPSSHLHRWGPTRPDKQTWTVPRQGGSSTEEIQWGFLANGLLSTKKPAGWTARLRGWRIRITGRRALRNRRRRSGERRPQGVKPRSTTSWGLRRPGRRPGGQQGNTTGLVGLPKRAPISMLSTRQT